MHDVLVGVALLFFVTVRLAIFHGLYLERRVGILGAGLACLGLVLFNATLNYGGVHDEMLPVVPKAGVVAWVGWLFVPLITKPQPLDPARQA